MVDTTPPAVTANQPPVEVAVDGIAGGGYVNGSVIFNGTTTNATSGVNRIEISTNGNTLTSIMPNADGTWTLDWDSTMLPDGTYTPVITAVDNAGNRTDFTMQPLTLDNSAPAMSITGGWYIWDNGHIVTYDTRVGIARIELSVRDDQNRWPAREWDYDTKKLEMDLQWDRKFGDGTVAPPGTYEVLLQAWDRLGNGRWITARIYIPEAGATAVIPYDGMVTAGNAEPTSTPLPIQPAEETPAAAVGGSEPQPTNTPLTTRTMIAVPISGGEENTVILASVDGSGDSAPANTTPISNGILWGAAAVAAGAAAAVVSQKQLEDTRKKEQAILDAKAHERLIQHWSNVIASYGGTYDHEATLKQIAEKEKFWNDYWIASQQKYYEEQRIKANEAAAANAAAAAKAAFEASNPEIAAMINSQEQLKDENDARRYATEAAMYQALAEAYYAKEVAKEYSNQVKSFREGEQTSSESYEKYVENQSTWIENSIATILNWTSGVLGSLNGSIGKPIEKVLGSEVTQDIYNFSLGAGKEIMLSNFSLFYAAYPQAADGLMPSITESRETQAGRIFGDVLSILMGLGQIGFGVFGGGVGVVVGCGTTLCLSSAPSAVVGATIAVNGTVTSFSAATALGANVRTYMDNNKSGYESSSDNESKSTSANSNVTNESPKTRPSRAYNADAEPTGKPTSISNAMDEATTRALIRENEAAETLAKNGYTIEQNPIVDGTTRKPDYRIEGEIFDCYSPDSNTSVRNIASNIEEKVIEKGQTSRVVVNLDDWNGEISNLVNQLNDYPIAGLDEVLIVRDGSVLSIFP